MNYIIISFTTSRLYFIFCVSFCKVDSTLFRIYTLWSIISISFITTTTGAIAGLKVANIRKKQNLLLFS